jgi:hypothetical protein
MRMPVFKAQRAMSKRRKRMDRLPERLPAAPFSAWLAQRLAYIRGDEEVRVPFATNDALYTMAMAWDEDTDWLYDVLKLRQPTVDFRRAEAVLLKEGVHIGAVYPTYHEEEM